MNFGLRLTVVVVLLVGVVLFGAWLQQMTAFQQFIGTLLGFAAVHYTALLIVAFMLIIGGGANALVTLGWPPQWPLPGQPLRVRDQLGYTSLVMGKVMLLYTIVGALIR